MLVLPAAHGKCVTAIAADRAGARLLTGGEDYQLQMFDFGGMKRDMRSFRKLQPLWCAPLRAASTPVYLVLLRCMVRSTGTSVPG
jgi:hypothetical protein